MLELVCFKNAFNLSTFILIGWITIVIASYIVQFAWAWIDDGEMDKYNWVLRKIKIKMSCEKEWIYPVYNFMNEKPFGYAKDKKFDGWGIQEYDNKVRTLEEGVDYIYKSKIKETLTYRPYIIVLSILSPLIMFFMWQLNIYVISVVSFLTIAHLARYARRIAKKLKAHMVDPNAHVETKKEE